MFAFYVEKDVPCYSDGNIASPTPLTDDFTDVSKAFQVTLAGCAIIPFVGIGMLILTVIFLYNGCVTKVAMLGLVSICLTFVALGFSIALFVVRLRPSGVLCSEYYLPKRGLFIYIYFWTVVTIVGLGCLIGCGGACLVRYR